MIKPVSGLLVSVRSAAEVMPAIAGGATLIDVKEPDRGPLGKADDVVIEAVVAEVGRRLPVSAALGEWANRDQSLVPEGVSFTKWGLANVEITADTILAVRNASSHPVLVAYADHERARSPSLELLSEWAYRMRFSAFLIDTAIKDGTSLLDWLNMDLLARIRYRLGAARIPIALAGSLSVKEIRSLLPITPDWFAVRGSVCDGGRQGNVSAAKVRQLADLIGRPHETP